MQFMEAVFRGREQFFFLDEIFHFNVHQCFEDIYLENMYDLCHFFFSLGKQIEFEKFEIVEIDKLIISARKLQP